LPKGHRNMRKIQFLALARSLKKKCFQDSIDDNVFPWLFSFPIL
jgi:hypothetical protein